MLEKPVTGGYTGAAASAPIFRNIASRLHVTTDRFDRQPEPVITGRVPVVVPDVTNLERSAAGDLLEAHGFDVAVSGEGNVVLGQSPEPGARVRPGSVVRLLVQRGHSAAAAGSVLVPDVRGLAIRRAVNRLTVAGLDVSLEGSGVVSAQSPAAGQSVAAGSCVSLRCSPGASPAAVRH